jgi:lysozyme
MIISDKGLSLISGFESFSARPYHGDADKPTILTIGYGHVIKTGEIFTKFTQEQAFELLRKDCKIAEKCINEYLGIPLNQNQFDALVSFVFNVGCNAFKYSTMLFLLNNKHLDDAADEFGKWIYANGVKVNGLVNRREKERELFLTEE